MIEKIAEYRKAIAALIVPGLIALGTALADGVITAQEWVGIAIATLGTAAAVAAVPNAQNHEKLARKADSPEEIAAVYVTESALRSGGFSPADDPATAGEA